MGEEYEELDIDAEAEEEEAAEEVEEAAEEEELEGGEEGEAVGEAKRGHPARYRRTRARGRLPTTTVLGLDYYDYYANSAAPLRRTSPYLTNYEYATLLRIRAEALTKLSREELYELSSVPPQILDRLAEEGKRAAIASMRDLLREFERGHSPRNLAKTRKVPASAADLPLWEKAQRYPGAEVERLQRIIRDFSRLPGPIDPADLARAEWTWRKKPGYGMPYFLRRQLPDGTFEVWQLHELEHTA